MRGRSGFIGGRYDLEKKNTADPSICVSVIRIVQTNHATDARKASISRHYKNTWSGINTIVMRFLTLVTNVRSTNMSKVKMLPLDDIMEQMIISAERYALGRMTYTVSDTVDFILPLVPSLTTQTLRALEMDFQRVESENERRSDDFAGMDFDLWGMEQDKEQWFRMRKSVKLELERRSEDET